MTIQQLTDWFIEKVAEETGQEKSQILASTNFKNFNLDSLSTVTIAYDLEKELGIDIDPTIFYEFDTIEKLSLKISEDLVANSQ